MHVRSEVQQIQISTFTHSVGNSNITMLSINMSDDYKNRRKSPLVRQQISKGEGEEICLRSLVDVTLFTNVVFPFLFFFTVPSLFASIA